MKKQKRQRHGKWLISYDSGRDLLFLVKYSTPTLSIIVPGIIHISYNRIIAFFIEAKWKRRRRRRQYTTHSHIRIFRIYALNCECLRFVGGVDNNAINHHFFTSLLFLFILLRLPPAISKFNFSTTTTHFA